MAWSTPRTWSSGELVTAGNMNTYISDNLRETGVAKAAAAGDVLYATAANALTRLAIGASGTVLTSNGSAPTWGGGPAYVKLSETVYASDTAGNTFTFSSISGAYRSLEMVISARDTNGGTSIGLNMQCNGDTSSSYGYIQWSSTGSSSSMSTASAVSTTQIGVGAIPGAGATASRHGAFTIRIHDYTIAKHKAVEIMGGFTVSDTAANWFQYHVLGFWKSTSTITSITLSDGSGWAAGTVFTLYGLT